jgi:hypothetical protein
MVAKRNKLLLDFYDIVPSVFSLNEEVFERMVVLGPYHVGSFSEGLVVFLIEHKFNTYRDKTKRSKKT